MLIHSLRAAAEFPPVRIASAVTTAFVLMLIALLAVRPEMVMPLVHSMSNL